MRTTTVIVDTHIIKKSIPGGYVHLGTFKKHVKRITHELRLTGLLILIEPAGGNWYDRADQTVHLDTGSASCGEYGLDWDERAFYNSLAHEMRHAWQDAPGKYFHAEDDFAAYYNQPCEVDARAYADEYVSRHF